MDNRQCCLHWRSAERNLLLAVTEIHPKPAVIAKEGCSACSLYDLKPRFAGLCICEIVNLSAGVDEHPDIEVTCKAA